MRRLFLFIFLGVQPLVGALTVRQPIKTESVILINGKTGKVLWEKNRDGVLCFDAR